MKRPEFISRAAWRLSLMLLSLDETIIKVRRKLHRYVNKHPYDY